MFRKRSYQNHFWIALLEPTGLSFEKISFDESYQKRYGRSYTDYDEDELDFEDNVQEEEFEPTCQNCMFNGTESCPFMDIGDEEKPQRCDQWHEIIEV